MSDTLDIWLGSQAGGGSSVEAEMANLFIYDQTMSEAQAESQHRALLWTDILPGDEEYNGTSTVTITYGYDPLYRLTSASYSAGAGYVYTYDAVGNRQTMTSPEGEVGYTYDAANRLTSVGGVAYTWDANGNLTSDGVRGYTYDHANRLTQVTQGSVTTQFAYNGDGVRTSKTVGADTTEYVLDLLATLPVVISDTDAVYLYGLDIIAQQQSERLYYMHDGLGSVRELVDSTGDMESSYAYDPFGVPLAGGDVYNPYQYTGEAWDGEVELLYLRARYYQPQVGRFITKDPWTGDVWRPGTLDGYVYVTNNPINLVDRTGYQGCIDVHCEPPMVDAALKIVADTLERDYGIVVGAVQVYHEPSGARGLYHRYTLWSNWEKSQLQLVGEAAGDLAAQMEGGKATLKARIGPVRVYKREGELVVFGDAARGWTSPFSITFAGFWWDDVSGQKWTVVHELAHWWDFRNGTLMSGGLLARAMWSREVGECELPRAETEKATLEVRGWKRGRSKAGLNPREDWAESVAAYVYQDYAAREGKEISRDRWDYVGQYMNHLQHKPYPWSESMFER